jgi:hypothetical protein
MPEQPQFGSYEVFRYANRQLQERRRDLDELNLSGLSGSEYQNCRRSLLQAISELEELVAKLDPAIWRGEV